MAGRTTRSGTRSAGVSKTSPATPERSGRNTGTGKKTRPSKESKRRFKRGTPLEIEVNYKLDSKHLERERTSYVLEKILKYSWMMPSWLRFVTVVIAEEGNSEDLAECLVSPQYRKAWIVLHPGFWDDDQEEQDRTVLEEITHLLQGNTIEAFAKIMKQYVPADQQDYVFGVYSEAIERDVHEIMEVAEAMASVD